MNKKIKNCYFVGNIHTGFGERQANNLLTVLNCRGISHKALQARETEVGEILASLAEQQCDAALKREQEMSG